MSEEVLEAPQETPVVEEVVAPVPVAVFNPLGQSYYEVTGDFELKGFRAVKAGEFITISPDTIRDFGLTDKVRLVN